MTGRIEKTVFLIFIPFHPESLGGKDVEKGQEE